MAKVIYKFDIEARNSEPGVLFHLTADPMSVLQDREIKLSVADFNDSEQEIASELEYPFFLSTARSISNTFFANRLRNGAGIAILILDKSKLKNLRGIKITPVDFYKSRDIGKEAEERVFSNDDAIPIGVVKGIVIILRPYKSEGNYRSLGILTPEGIESLKKQYAEVEKARLKRVAAIAQQAMKLAKNRNIPVEVYHRVADYIRKDSIPFTMAELQRISDGYVPPSNSLDIPEKEPIDRVNAFLKMMESVDRNKGIKDINDFDDKESLDLALTYLYSGTHAQSDLMSTLGFNTSPSNPYYRWIVKTVKFLRANGIKMKGSSFQPIETWMKERLESIPNFEDALRQFLLTKTSSKPSRRSFAVA